MIKQILKKIIIFILRVEARVVLFKYKPRIIAVTGSVGKTTTKDAVFSVVSEFLYAQKSKKSYNSEIGLPLTILQCESGWDSPVLWGKNILKGAALIMLKNHYPKLLVLEVGIDKPGGMKKATRLIKPDVAIFTRLPDVPVHVEFFDTPEKLHNEKWQLALALRSGGTIIINNDDPLLRKRLETVKSGINRITYGEEEGASIVADNVHVTYDEPKKVPSGIAFKVEHTGNNIPIKIPGVLGKAYVYAALAAIAAGISQNLNLVQISNALSNLDKTPGRLRILPGSGGSVIIDDTYNSSPEAVRMAADTLSSLEANRKILVLGDMLELGKFTKTAHMDVGEFIAGKNIDLMYLVGPRAKWIGEGANSKGMKKKYMHFYLDAKKAGENLAKIISEGDVILLKGSQGIRLEKAVAEILSVSEEKEKLLVRQEKEWLNR